MKVLCRFLLLDRRTAISLRGAVGGDNRRSDR